jgi:hypothetical protein
VSALADAFLRLARATLGSPVLPAPVAVRTAALLARTTVEHEVAARVAAALPGAEGGSTRAQLLCLRSADERVGEDASHLHGALSSACHQHPYELGPSVDELLALLEGVERFTATPAAAAPTASGHRPGTGPGGPTAS